MTSFSEAGQEMAALLQQFLTTPSPIFEGPNAGIVQVCAVERLAQTLKHFLTGEDVAMSTVHALLNTLYNHNTTAVNENAESRGQSILIQENVVVAISKIACVFKGEKVLITLDYREIVLSESHVCQRTNSIVVSFIFQDHSYSSIHVGATNPTPQPQVGLCYRIELDGYGSQWIGEFVQRHYTDSFEPVQALDFSRQQARDQGTL